MRARGHRIGMPRGGGTAIWRLPPKEGTRRDLRNHRLGGDRQRDRFAFRPKGHRRHHQQSPGAGLARRAGPQTWPEHHRRLRSGCAASGGGVPGCPLWRGVRCTSGRCGMERPDRRRRHQCDRPSALHTHRPGRTSVQRGRGRLGPRSACGEGVQHLAGGRLGPGSSAGWGTAGPLPLRQRCGGKSGNRPPDRSTGGRCHPRGATRWPGDPPNGADRRSQRTAMASSSPSVPDRADAR
jgi:hypothetical protein